MNNTIINNVEVVAYKNGQVFQTLNDGSYLFFVGAYQLDALTGRIYCPFKKKLIVKPDLFKQFFYQDEPTLGMKIPGVGMFSVLSKDKVEPESLPCFETSWDRENNQLMFHPIRIKNNEFVPDEGQSEMPEEADVYKTWYFFGQHPLLSTKMKEVNPNIKTYRHLKAYLDEDNSVKATDL